MWKNKAFVHVTFKFMTKTKQSNVNLVYMSLLHSLFQQLLSHFQQCYQRLLSYVKVKNVLQYDTTPQQTRLIKSHLGFMSGQPRAKNECGKVRFTC